MRSPARHSGGRSVDWLVVLAGLGLIGFAVQQVPEMDGFECTASIRSKEHMTRVHLPVIAMTAHAMTGDEARCLAAGMDAYLSKPIDPNALFDVVDWQLLFSAGGGELRRTIPRDSAALQPVAVIGTRE